MSAACRRVGPLWRDLAHGEAHSARTWGGMASDVQFHLAFGGYRRSSARRSPSCREAGGVAANSPASKTVTRLRRTGVQAFSKLPPPARLAFLHARGRYAPWEEGFDFTPPALGGWRSGRGTRLRRHRGAEGGDDVVARAYCSPPASIGPAGFAQGASLLRPLRVANVRPCRCGGVPRLVPSATWHPRWRVDARLCAHALGPRLDGPGRARGTAPRSPS